MKKIIICAFTAIVVFSSCKKEGCTDPAALNYEPKAKKDDGTCEYEHHTSQITFEFDGQVDETYLNMDTMKYSNAAGNLYEINTLKFIISDIILHKDDGSRYKIDTFHYRDTRDAATRELVIEDVPDGYYTGISFTFGLDSADNVSGALPNQQVYNNMEWQLGGGAYHYMKLEGKFEDTTSSTNEASYALHMGALEQNGTYYDNSFAVHFSNTALDIQKDAWQVHIVMEINEWYKDSNVVNFYDGWASIMSDQAKQQILKENGQSVFVLHHVSQIGYNN